MKYSFILTLAALLVGSVHFVASAAAAPSSIALKGGESAEEVQQAYAKALTPLWPTLGKRDAKPLETFEAIVHHAARPGAEAERLACCQIVAAALQGDAPIEAKVWMLKLTEFTARAELVPAQTTLLDSPEPLLRESARAALQHNTAPAAATALRQALGKATEPGWQAALALALGARHDAASVPAIAKLLRQTDEAVVEAALSALGSIATPEAAKALVGASQTVPENLRPAAAEAHMKCAERLLKTGRASEAAKIYQDLYQPQQPRPVRLAALAGILKTSGDAAATKILELLAGQDADGRAVAAGYIPDLTRGGLTILAGGLNRLPAATQVLVLGTLAERGEKAALPVALAFARSNDEANRIAGLTALARLGDASAVPVLVEALGTGGNAANVAKESLTRVPGPEAEEKIIAAMRQETNSGRRATLVEVLDLRGDVAAVPVLLEEIVSENAGMRRPAMRALGKLAQPKDVPALSKGLLKAAPGGERDDAEKAIASTCARVTEPVRPADPVLELYRGAGGAEQLALLQVLGRIGGPKALETIKTTLASSDAAIYQAGLTAISNWPDSDDAVESELLTLIEHAGKAGDRSAAFRAYVRVIGMPSGLPEASRLRKYQKALELAANDPDRSFVLERVGEIRRLETLQLVEPYLEQPALAQRACATILDLARDRDLRGRHKAEFTQALQKVQTTCKDAGLLERAKRYLAEK